MYTTYHNTAKRHSQNRKLCQYWASLKQKSSFRAGFVNQRFRNFLQMTLTWVIQQKTWLESSHHCFSTWFESSRVTKNRDTSQWLASRYHWKQAMFFIIGGNFLPFNQSFKSVLSISWSRVSSSSFQIISINIFFIPEGVLPTVLTKQRNENNLQWHAKNWHKILECCIESPWIQCLRFWRTILLPETYIDKSHKRRIDYWRTPKDFRKHGYLHRFTRLCVFWRTS